MAGAQWAWAGVVIGLLGFGAGCDLLGGGPDERAPRVEILRPFDEAAVGGDVLVRAVARPLRDDNYISFVNLVLDGDVLGQAELVEVGEEGATTFVYRWDTSEHDDGAYRLEAIAFDKYQARGLSAPIDVRIGNQSAGRGPASELLSPRDGDDVSGTVPVIVRAEGAAERIDVLIDGVAVASLNEGPFVYLWDTAQEAEGLHLVQAKVYTDDEAFSYTEIAEVTVVAEGGVGIGTTAPGFPRFQTGGFRGTVDGSVAIGFNDNVYLGTRSDTLYAFTPDGRLRWRFGARGPIHSSPVVANNEDVFFTSEDGKLYGLTAGGGLLWTPYDAESVLRSTPAIDVDGTLYFGDGEGRVHAVSSYSGQPKAGWPIKVASGPVVAPPVIGRDRVVYAASTDGYLYAYTHEGDLVWRSQEHLGSMTAALALVDQLVSVEDAVVLIPLLYAVTTEGTAYSINALDGAVSWRYTLGSGAVLSSPIVGPDGSVYIGTSTGLVALIGGMGEFEGRLRFIHRAEDVGTPVIDSNEIIYFTSRNRLVAINANNTPLWDYDLRAEADGPLTIGRNGLLYVAADNELLYGINTGSDGLAPSKWPMFQRNARHTGRVGEDADDG